MRVEINETGLLTITAETGIESYALGHWWEKVTDLPRGGGALEKMRVNGRLLGSEFLMIKTEIEE